MLKREIIYEPKDLADLAKTKAAHHRNPGKSCRDSFYQSKIPNIKRTLVHTQKL